MGFRFFTDHCVPNSLVQTLRELSHEILVLKEHLPQNFDDRVVIAKAQELGAILVSLNGDFADIVIYPPAQYLGIFALQVRNHPEALPALTRRLVSYLSAHPETDHY
jgi:predicted nuclease of predicted toxin-antitoxin system